MAEHKERSQLLGDFLRDVAVLMIVFYPLDAELQNKFDWNVFGFIVFFSLALLWFGMILEGRDEL